MVHPTNLLGAHSQDTDDKTVRGSQSRRRGPSVQLAVPSAHARLNGNNKKKREKEASLHYDSIDYM